MGVRSMAHSKKKFKIQKKKITLFQIFYFVEIYCFLMKSSDKMVRNKNLNYRGT
jgi:hypothetical protein